VRRAGLALGVALAAALATGAARAQQPPAAPAPPGPEAPPTPPVPERVYDVLFDAQVAPTERVARASIGIGGEGARDLRWLRFQIDPARHVDVRGDGIVRVEGDSVLWTPPAAGGKLRYTFRIDQLRTSSSYDARCAENWAIFRGGDLFPAARVRAEEGARSRSRLRLRVPDGWSVVVPYDRRGSTYVIDHPHRRFDRPTGWMAMGQLGVLRETIAGTRLAVAGPVGQGLQRHDLLAFLRWTLPPLRSALGELPDRLLVVGAGDPMWRGGLSAPKSVYLHAARPLISSDMSSPLLHELMHSVMNAHSGRGGDWIVEGFAELYSLELLKRSKSMSKRRFAKALDRKRERAARVSRVDVAEADGDVTAWGVVVLYELDREIRRISQDGASLDDVMSRLARWREPITPALLRRAVAEAAGSDLDGFFRARGIGG
jgi:hypothetical protein